MKRLWPVALAAITAGHAIWTGNATGFVVSLWLGVVYVAALGVANPDRRGHAGRVDLGHLNDLELRRIRDRHEEPVR